MSSVYPGALDSFPTNRTDTSANLAVQAPDHNRFADAINKIEAELGVDPSGTYSTLKARLDAFITEDMYRKALGVVAWTMNPHDKLEESQKNSMYLHGEAVLIRKGDVVTNMSMFVSTARATTHAYLSIYDKNFGKLAESADTPAFGGTQGYRSVALTSPWTCPATDLYYLCELLVAGAVATSASMPSIAGNYMTPGTQAGRGQLPTGAYQAWFDSNAGTGYTTNPATATPVAGGSSSGHLILAY